jgi:hypothetical protein
MSKRKPRSGTIGRRRGSRTPRTDYDSFWKEALDRYFERFMAFVFPRAHAEIDWTRGYEMLDKELQPIVRQAKRGRRYVDKLVKVWLESGQERWILIHVEVQTGKEGEFPKRMVVYNHRLFDRYDREVISLAILADDNPDWRPNHFGYERWGFRTVTEFPIVKLLDYLARGPELEADPNPFALVVLAHLKTLETRRSLADRYAWKLRLVKSLYERGMHAEEIRQLFRFIDWIMELPEERDRQFWREITAYQREKVMPFVTIAERIGMEKGLEEGETAGLLKGIEACLELKFGAAGLTLMPELREIHDPVVLEKILHAIRSAATPEDLRRVWTRKRRSKRE